MAKKTLKELKAQMFVLTTQLNQIVENESIENEAKDELEEVLSELFLFSTLKACDEQNENMQEATQMEQNTNNEFAIAGELKEICRSASSTIELISQRYALEDSVVEKIEESALDLNILSRQFSDLKEENTPKRSKVTLEDFFGKNINNCDSKTELDANLLEQKTKTQEESKAFSGDKK